MAEGGVRNLPTDAALAEAVELASEMLSTALYGGARLAGRRGKLAVVDALTRLFPDSAVYSLGRLVLPDYGMDGGGRIYHVRGLNWWRFGGAQAANAVLQLLMVAPQSDRPAPPSAVEARRINLALGGPACTEKAFGGGPDGESDSPAPAVRARPDNGGQRFERDQVARWRSQRFGWAAIAANLGRPEPTVRALYDPSYGGAL